MYLPKTNSRQGLSSQPLVSIIIPTYEYGGCVESAYKSAAGQTYKNIEIIFVDDASTDDTLTILNDIAKEDKRVKVIHKEHNEGISAARNAGLDIARGDYICFADVDDAMDSRMIEVLLSHCIASNAPIACCGTRISRGRRATMCPYYEWSESYEDCKKLRKELRKTFGKGSLSIVNTADYLIMYYTSTETTQVELWTLVTCAWAKIYSRSAIGDTRFLLDQLSFEDCVFNAQVFGKSLDMIIDSDYIGYFKSEHEDSAGYRGEFDEEWSNKTAAGEGLCSERILKIIEEIQGRK